LFLHFPQSTIAAEPFVGRCSDTSIDKSSAVLLTTALPVVDDIPRPCFCRQQACWCDLFVLIVFVLIAAFLVGDGS
jgi:hypothetical protein